MVQLFHSGFVGLRAVGSELASMSSPACVPQAAIEVAYSRAAFRSASIDAQVSVAEAQAKQTALGAGEGGEGPRG